MNKKTKLAIGIGAPLILFTGCITGTAIGTGMDSDTSASTPTPTETVTATPEPAPTVTETATPEPAPTVTETPEPEIVTEEVEVEVASQACLDALDAGDRSIDLLIEGLDYSAQAMDASARLDIAGIDQATAEIEALTPQLEDAGFDWGFWAAECRDEAK